jgi:hypothetical protein
MVYRATITVTVTRKKNPQWYSMGKNTAINGMAQP